MRKTSRWLKALSLLSVLWVWFVWLGGGVLAEKTPVTTALAYTPQALLIAPALLAPLILLLGRRWKALLTNLAFTLPVGWVLLGYQSRTPIQAVPTRVLRVLTYNVHHGQGGMANIVKTILAEKPDVFCLQEANFRDRLLFPGYEIFKTDQFLIGTTDKIEGLKLAPLVHGYPNALEFRTHGVRVVNIHLASFAFQHVARQRLLGVPGHMMDIARLHERQIEKLMGHYEKDAVPTVICGDFNNPPRGKNYQRMTRSFMDSFAKTGSGFGYTFPSNMPLQRIDYIFARGLEPVSAKVVFTRASDHMPVVATFDTGHLPPVYVLRGSARPARS